MYLALTYDHRLLDGREAVTFLVKVCHSIRFVKLRTDSVAGQGVHRGPPPHAARLIDSHRDYPYWLICLLCLEQPLAPTVDYLIFKYECCSITGYRIEFLLRCFQRRVSKWWTGLDT